MVKLGDVSEWVITKWILKGSICQLVVSRGQSNSGPRAAEQVIIHCLAYLFSACHAECRVAY